MPDNPLLKKLHILDLIEQQDGEIDDYTNVVLQNLEKDLPTYIDNICLYRKGLQADIEKYKTLLENYIKAQESKLQNLDKFLLPTLEKLGKQYTPLCTLYAQEHASESVCIDDFEMCCRAYPHAVKVNIMPDNSEKRIKLSKGELREEYKSGKTCHYFKVIKTISKSVQVRIKGSK